MEQILPMGMYAIIALVGVLLVVFIVIQFHLPTIYFMKILFLVYRYGNEYEGETDLFKDIFPPETEIEPEFG